MAEGEEGEEHVCRSRDGPPEEVRPPEGIAGDQEDRKAVDMEPVGVDVSPARPWAEAGTVVERQRQREDDKVPDHERERHRHEPEVARGSEPSARGGKMAREGRSSLEEVPECESYDKEPSASCIVRTCRS